MNTGLSHSRAWLAQFRGLEGRHPAYWPPLPRSLCAVGLGLLLVMGGGWFLWQPQYDELDEGRQRERTLRADFEQKVAQTQHLEGLRAQKAAVEAEVVFLEKQLPGQAEMEALLTEISRAGVARGLQFELFKPAPLRFSEHYAELPIEIKLSGKFHALAGFVSDVANMPRIVTLDGLSFTQQPRDGTLSFSCVAHAFRDLDAAEVALHKQQAAERRKQAKK